MTKKDTFFMSLAVKEAQKSKEPVKCGVVITKDGEVIAKATNSQRSDNNPTAHAEINAIRKAGEMVKSHNLEGCTIYCTCEPCVMCLSAILYADIQKLIYAVSLKNLSPTNKRINIKTKELLSATQRKIEVVKGFMEKEVQKTTK